jgi:polyhydroxyalkanoate synthesis regulator phasin
MFMNKSGDMNSANSTARIDTLVQQVQTKDARLKELEEENKRLKGIVDELESLRAPGATTDSVGV